MIRITLNSHIHKSSYIHKYHIIRTANLGHVTNTYDFTLRARAYVSVAHLISHVTSSVFRTQVPALLRRRYGDLTRSCLADGGVDGPDVCLMLSFGTCMNIYPSSLTFSFTVLFRE